MAEKDAANSKKRLPSQEVVGFLKKRGVPYNSQNRLFREALGMIARKLRRQPGKILYALFWFGAVSILIASESSTTDYRLFVQGD